MKIKKPANSKRKVLSLHLKMYQNMRGS